MKGLGKMLFALAISAVFVSLLLAPAAQACEEGRQTSSDISVIAVGKGAPSVTWTIKPDKIAVYIVGSSRKLLQEIPYDAAYLPLSDSDRVIAEDLNFDGYTDLKIMASRGQANVYYACWLWNKTKQKFVLHEELSQVASPRFDASTKTIFSFTHISATDSTKATYMFQHGKLRLLELVEQAYEKAGNVIITRKYKVDKQGARHLIDEQAVPAEQDAVD